MHVTKKQLSPTQVLLTITASEATLSSIKQAVLKRLAKDVKAPGFRAGKVPLNLVEKQLDSQALQSEFLNAALEQLYPDAAESEKVRPVRRPDIAIKKFVPFTELEFAATIDVLGPVKLADYKKFKVTAGKVSVTEKDLKEVLETLGQRMAEKKEVARAAKNGDEVVLDFKGTNTKKQPIAGAEATDYPLILGSKSFIPGFEEEVLGLKTGDTKTFTVTFPKDYHAAALAGTKVTFAITIKKVQELVAPKADDAFAKKVGPFKDLTELKADIKKQLTQEREDKTRRDQELELVDQLVAKSTVTLPESLVADQVEQELTQLKQRLAQQGQTFKEFLDTEGQTEDVYRKKTATPEAERKLKISLLLAEVSEAEKLTITPEELDLRMQMLKAQYQDPQMQAELDKPETRRDIASRILTEKTLTALTTYSTKNT